MEMVPQSRFRLPSWFYWLLALVGAYLVYRCREVLIPFLVGRGQPLSRMDGARWLQMAGTVSSMFAALRAAAENASAAEAAEASAEAGNPAGAAPAAAPSPAPDALGTAAPAPSMARAPAPAEAATELSER